MAQSIFKELIKGIQEGQIIPYLGPGILQGSVNVETGTPIPADSDSLIYALNDGKPMAPRLMYEFARAAMHVELKRGRSSLTKFLDKLYGETKWTRAPFHDWLATIKPKYVIDINRDTQLQESYSDTPHTLIRGVARIAGTDYRFIIYHYDGKKYSEVNLEDVDTSLPVLFKPMGTPLPAGEYIASDADYVDYITELMGGFAIPSFVKEYRKGKQYLFLGTRMTRDTERMVLSDIIYSAGAPAAWALIPYPTDKEKRFCKRLNIEIIESDIADLLQEAGVDTSALVTEISNQSVGC
ncbi:MAG: SIR2 family protein [Gammaproteobacteria bacterium]